MAAQWPGVSTKMGMKGAIHPRTGPHVDRRSTGSACFRSSPGQGEVVQVMRSIKDIRNNMLDDIHRSAWTRRVWCWSLGGKRREKSTRESLLPNLQPSFFLRYLKIKPCDVKEGGLREHRCLSREPGRGLRAP